MVRKDILATTSCRGKKKFIFLEVGCGTGCVSLSLLSAIPNIEAVAIDVNPLAVETTKKNAEQQVSFFIIF